MIRTLLAFTGLFLLLLALPACSKNSGTKTEPGMPKVVPKMQMLESANHFSDAAFAFQIRDYPRAKQSLEKALEIRPDIPEWWESLGYACKLMNKTSEARKAYKKASSLWEDAYDDSGRVDFAMRQVVILLLLHEDSDARNLVEKLAKKFPKDAKLQDFIKSKGIDQILSDPEIQAKRL
jgi:tetratricopeptide (TPR) repeat protein